MDFPASGAPERIRVLDLFSGAGGLSEGFRRASERFETLRAIEFDAAAAATYEANHGADKVFAGSIQDWLRTEEIPSADLIIGGPPCQGFSALGKQDVNDERNDLWEYYAQTIKLSAPKYFVLENVPTFLDSDQFFRFRNKTRGNGFLREYKFEARILNAAEYGAAQIRKRVILIGHHRDLAAPSFPTIADAFKTRDGWVTLSKALEGLTQHVQSIDLPERSRRFGDRVMAGAFRSDELHLTRHYEDISKKRFKAIPAGGNRFSLPDDLKPKCWRNHTTGAGDVMGRLSWDKPAVTIRTEFFKPEKGRYLHPTEDRALTHHEAARIQGFRDDYEWVGSKTSIARQIGNAVPIPLAEAIGAHLAKQF
ncbi:DNA cytosine methyltransferase [Pseudolysinimonas yzui]|uniref:Cytosine-specific methyltransferase n=1 Tax=Pseudolysinimonas yzui TaxID=2708254 RepID=A0A8J3GPM0_9MICO|nr:DNA cytosine methyltransferase [Pseudolysinimonas yzui]GHF11811.1 cytosine-specific methyltransferase [Pseudolysinimonas yzui]